MRAFVLALSLLLSFTTAAVAQDIRPAPPWPQPKHQLLIIGTFHFSDAGLDSYRPQFDVNIQAPERQRQVQELVAQIAAFRPTKVAVEQQAERQPRLDSLFAAYIKGTYTLASNEIYQVGFRLARAAGHSRVYAVDAQRRFFEPWVDPDSFAVARSQQSRLDPDLDSAYACLWRWEDEYKTRVPLKDYLLHVNDPAFLLRSHGQYLIGNFEVGTSSEYPGADAKTGWYNRNLRIFANLQRLLDSDSERIVLLIGHGHVPIIRHAAQASPQFRLVELSEVLGSRP